MRSSHVLVVGMRALAAEICKNLVLTGVGSVRLPARLRLIIVAHQGTLTILDHHNVAASDLGAQFFLSSSDIGKNVRCRLARPDLSHRVVCTARHVVVGKPSSVEHKRQNRR